MLKEVSDSKQRRMMDALLQRLLSAEPIHDLSRQADLDRGFINGMNYLTIAVPTGAVRMLARADTRAEMGDEPDVDFWSYEEMG